MSWLTRIKVWAIAAFGIGMATLLAFLHIRQQGYDAAKNEAALDSAEERNDFQTDLRNADAAGTHGVQLDGSKDPNDRANRRRGKGRGV